MLKFYRIDDTNHNLFNLENPFEEIHKKLLILNIDIADYLFKDNNYKDALVLKIFPKNYVKFNIKK
jgi:hypothetical protein